MISQPQPQPQPWATTVENLTEHHYSEYPTGPAPILETLSSGDYCLTRESTDGTVVFIDIIDCETGEFVSTARPTPTPTPTD